MRKSGILLAISSLPSKYGIGTFSKEAYDFVDFLHKAGQSMWQILPLGPTGYGDSPYQSFSTFAGNPYYIDLEEPDVQKETTCKNRTNATVNDSPEQKTYSWNVTAIPVSVSDTRNTSMIVLDSRWYDKNGLWNALTEIEKLLYGSEEADPKLVLLSDIETIVNKAAVLLDDFGSNITDENNNPIFTAVYNN